MEKKTKKLLMSSEYTIRRVNNGYILSDGGLELRGYCSYHYVFNTPSAIAKFLEQNLELGFPENVPST